MESLSAKDIICGAVKELTEVMADTHMHERGALREIEHPQLGPMTIFSSPVRFNGEASAPRSPVRSMAPTTIAFIVMNSAIRPP